MPEHSYDPLTIGVVLGLSLILIKLITMMPLWLVVVVGISIPAVIFMLQFFVVALVIRALTKALKPLWDFILKGT